MKELTKAFIQERIDEKNWKARHKANHIQLNDYFKVSGYIEETRELHDKWIYNEVRQCNQIHEYYEKIQKNDKNKSIKRRGTKEGFEFVG